MSVSSDVAYLKNNGQCDERDTAADGQHDGLLDILIAVLHLKINVKCADQNDDGGNGFHKVGNGRLIRADFLRGFGKTRRSLAARHRLRHGKCECAEGDCNPSSKHRA